MLKNESIVLGIDPGFDRVGWAVMTERQRKPLLINCGCFTSDHKLDRLTRYKQIEEFLEGLLTMYPVQISGIEQLYVSRNISTAIPVAEARGIMLSCLLRHEVSIKEFNPSTIKLAVTSNGHADKTAMRKMVMLQIGPVSAELKQRVQVELDDTIDAIGVALTALSVEFSN